MAASVSDELVRSRNWRQLARLLAAVVAVQIFFWGFFNPLLIQPKADPVDFVEVEQLSVARLASPDANGLAQAEFRPTEPQPTLHFPRGYHAVRAEIQLPTVPASGLAMLDQNGSDNMRIYVNGHIAYGEGEITLPDVGYNALTKQIIRIPPALLKPGVNRIDTVRTFDIPRLSGNLPSMFGDYDAVSRAFAWKNFLLGPARLISLAVGCVIALFIFSALLRAEQKGLLLWLLLLTVSWTLRSHFFLWADMPLHGFGRGIYYALLTLFLSACWPILVDEWCGRPLRFFKPAMLVIFAVAAAVIAWWLLAVQGDTAWDKATDLLDQAGMLFMAMMLGRMLWHFWRTPENRYWEAAILVSLGLLVAIFLYNIIVHGQNTPYLTLTQPLFLLAFTIAFFSRNFRLFRSSAQINAMLQTQLDERTAELRSAHARETELVRQQAHDAERQRIMRDMHDGLGSNLMSMLMMAKRGKASHNDYAEGLQQVIDEMRLMIDSMDSVGESLAGALSIFRKRVVPRAKAAGFDCRWDLQEGVILPDYTPRAVLQVFRILQEAYTNALKHSGGDRIDIAIRPSDDPDFALLLTVTDNGQGNAAKRGRGRGLDNMKARAASIGGRLEIDQTSAGTVVKLHAPAADASQPVADGANG